MRMRDSVIGAYKPDFLEKTSDSADLCAQHGLLHTIACNIILRSLMRKSVLSLLSHVDHAELTWRLASSQQCSCSGSIPTFCAPCARRRYCFYSCDRTCSVHWKRPPW